MVTSALTVGLGGSVGLEAPIVVTGSAIGSNIGRLAHLHYKERTLLIGCGSAAAVSAIFNSPIAGVIFASEVILSEVKISKFIPLLIASVAGSMISLLFGVNAILFSSFHAESFTISDVPFYIGLGVLCGLIALYVTRTHYFVESWIAKVSHPYRRAMVAGLFLGVIMLIFPPIYGEGYNTIKLLIAGQFDHILEHSVLFNEIDNVWFLALFMIGLVLIKGVASALTIGSGGSGGIFAPSLFVGGVAGFAYARIINLLGFSNNISTTNFTLVGMCGVMSGILHAPLTGIFLIAEITSGYTLFVPLMIVSAIAYWTIAYFEPHSIYTKHLVESGDLITHDKDQQVLSLLNFRKLIEKDIKIIDANASLGELVELIKKSNRNVFAVIDGCTLVGTIHLDDIRRIMFDKEKHHTVFVRGIMKIPKTMIYLTDDMPTVMKKFESSKSWNLPVVEDDIYIGFVSKSTIFNAYRKKLIRQNRDFEL
jgi:CIC family chloride channel protein